MAVVMTAMQQVQVDLGVGEVAKGLALGRVVMGEVAEDVAAASAVVASELRSELRGLLNCRNCSILLVVYTLNARA
jgi:hypothetical protein